MATKGAQSIQNTCTASNNVVDVSSHCEVVRKSDAQDRLQYVCECSRSGSEFIGLHHCREDL